MTPAEARRPARPNVREMQDAIMRAIAQTIHGQQPELLRANKLIDLQDAAIAVIEVMDRQGWLA